MLASLLTTLFVFSSLFPIAPSVKVSTKYGEIEGSTTSYPNASGQFKSVSKFLGVPFAAPPIGELRFKAPRPPKEWKPKVRQAKSHGNVCLQIGIAAAVMESNPFIKAVYNEDCLYLDVYTPNISQSLPVMVHIHGGAYVIGGAVLASGDILALQGVVVVNIQYRLGPFGFLTTGDSAAPGNFGMLDQVETLKWVKDNIANFGGNPSKVTIFGVSAGGTSVSLHLLSPLSKGLFHQAIAASGVDFTPFAIQPTSAGVGFAKELARKLDCTTSDHNAMVDCMRDKKDLAIKNASYALSKARFYHYNTGYLRWAPVVDKNFLDDTPQNLREKKDFKQVPLMVSFTSQEGASNLATIANMNVDNGVGPVSFKAFLTKLAHSRSINNNAELTPVIADALEFMYTPWPDKSDKYALRSQLVDFLTDYTFSAPCHAVAEIQSQVAPVYMYEFAYRRIKYKPNPVWMGVVHGDDFSYIFGMPLLPNFRSIFDEADRNVSKFIVATYANFARSSNPVVSGVAWEKFNSSYRAYLRVDVNPKMESSFNPRRMAFWNDYYPKLAQLKFETTEAPKSAASASVTMETFVHIVLVVILAML